LGNAKNFWGLNASPQNPRRSPAWFGDLKRKKAVALPASISKAVFFDN